MLDCKVDGYTSKNASAARGNAPAKKPAKLSHQIQVGLQKAFWQLRRVSVSKYDRSNLDVKLRDALFIVHPKAKDEAQQLLFDKITNKTLETPYTWETELSALGQQEFAPAEAKKEAFAARWEELVGSGKLGYLAMLRNLRNFLTCGVSGNAIEDVAHRLSDEREVIRSRQFPFRFLSAYREISGICNGNTHALLDALEKAVLAPLYTYNKNSIKVNMKMKPRESGNVGDSGESDISGRRETNAHKKRRPQPALGYSLHQKEAASYSPALHCSTIGADGLNFSVRNGKRWDPDAITT